jgi:hypothetical protein
MKSGFWIVLIVAAVLAVAIWRQPPNAAQPIATAPVESPGAVQVVSLNCDTDKTFGVISGVVRNTGTAPLESLNVFLRVEGRVVSVPVLTMQMPVGSMGEFQYAIGQARAVNGCEVVSVQDQQGRALL